MYEPMASCTVWLILATGLVSYLGFRSPAVEEQYIFNPERILAGKQYYRLVTAAFLHAGWRHLIFNMLSLYFFGPGIEMLLGRGQFLLIYFSAVVGGNLLSLYVHRHHEYRAYGASGGVGGIIFAHILLSPYGGISMFFIPIAIPGWLYAIVYLLVSFYGMKEHNRGNIGHDAHLGGSLIGFLSAAALNPEYVRYHPRIFFMILAVTILLLIYLWFNPLFLPAAHFFQRGEGFKARSARAPKSRRESLQVDAILDKISKTGVQNLTPEEKALLDEVSGKYRRRDQSKKPESGLAI